MSHIPKPMSSQAISLQNFYSYIDFKWQNYLPDTHLTSEVSQEHSHFK